MAYDANYESLDEFGTKLVPNSYILVLGTYGAVVEWALTIWEIVRGRK